MVLKALKDKEVKLVHKAQLDHKVFLVRKGQMALQVPKAQLDLQALGALLAYWVHLVPQDHKAVQAHLVFEGSREILEFQVSREKQDPKVNQARKVPKVPLAP